MNGDHFDSLAKRLITPTTRRASLGALAAGSFLGALGLGRAIPETRAAQGGTCLLAFVANVRLGPSTTQVMTAAGRIPGELRGDLSFSLSESGNLEDGSLRLADGSRLPVVGQATGHSLQMRIELAPRVSLVAVGVGEREITTCRGPIDGVATGPEIGDLGDWHAAPLQQGSGSVPSSSPSPTTGTAACAVGLTRCGGVCVDLATDRNHCGACGFSCATGETCGDGRCRGSGAAQCARGLTDCGGICVDLQSDMANCGACGEVCESGLVPVECRSGACERANCLVEETYCGAVDGCRNLTSDPEHCGACANACATGVCSGGVCGLAGATCPTGHANCGEGCVDLSNNDFNCGACGHGCDDGQVCQGGVCTGGVTCTGGLTDCAGSCVDLQTTPFHCGACGTVCPGADTDANPCIAGICVDQCTAHGLGNCPGGCRDLATDPAHCGACGHSCENGQGCQGGVCIGGAPQCTGGLIACGGVCVNLNGDALNCGVCGLECAYGEVCSGGACQSSCAAGLSFCNDVCVDTTSDLNHCGFCNNFCGGFSQCVSGACKSTGEELPGTALNCAARGLTDCGGVCVDLLTDDLNCGSCGNNCTNLAGYCDKGDGTCSVCSWRIGDPNPEPRCTS